MSIALCVVYIRTNCVLPVFRAPWLKLKVQRGEEQETATKQNKEKEQISKHSIARSKAYKRWKIKTRVNFASLGTNRPETTQPINYF